MNTNLQFAIANSHRQELHRQAANAQLAAEVRSHRSGTFTATARSHWLRARRLLAGATRVGAVTASAPLAGNASVTHGRW